MTPSEFSKLLERFKKGQATSEEIRQIERWYAYLGKQDYSSDEIDTDERKKRSLQNILVNREPDIRLKSRRRQVFLFRSVAASLVLISLFWFFRTSNNDLVLPGVALKKNSQKKHENNQIFENNSINNQLVILDDGSSILLSPGSKLTCKEGFGSGHRKTMLTGNAFFEVTPDPALPFFVLCEEVVTKVVGTSFYIKSTSKSVEVEVHTGRVSVFKKQPKASNQQDQPEKMVTLLANQKISFTTKFLESKINLTPPLPEPVLIKKPTHHFSFDDAPITKVFDALASEYSLAFTVSIPEPSKCSFTGDLNNLTLAEKLEIICFSTGTNFRIEENQITIYGDGCEN